MKHCNRCGEDKSLDQFSTNRSICKPCCVIDASEYRVNLKLLWMTGLLRRPDSKRCPGCSMVLLKDRFGETDLNRSGLAAYCYDCEAKRFRAFSKTKNAMINRARARAYRKQLEFSITESDFEIPDTCPALGIPLRFNSGAGKPCANSPCLDRIKNHQGYIPGNVVVVSHKMNLMKSDLSLEQFFAAADFYRSLVR